MAITEVRIHPAIGIARAAHGATHTADVAVIGGGPAGAVTALLLARAGVDVVLYESSQYDTLRLGETLPPSVNPLLCGLGLWQRFSALGSVPSHETASAWGAPEPAERSFLFSPHGNGWHVDRARFDRMLADAAEEAGATVRRGRRVRAVGRHGVGVLIEADDETLSAGAVVDATGRAAKVARMLGAERDPLDRLVCAARVFAVGAQPSGDTFIEAQPQGWWYASPLPEGRRLIACFTDAAQAVQARLASVDGWDAALAQTEHVRHLACGDGEAAVHVANCASHELHPAAGQVWIAVGDAALAVDPLSSGGVAFALRTAIEAARVLRGADRFAYRDFIADAAQEYRLLRQQIYGWEHRFAEHDFWRSRAPPRVPLPGGAISPVAAALCAVPSR